MKENTFFDISDGSTSQKIQVIIPSTLHVDHLTTGASVVASGPLNKTPKGQLELKANKLEVPGKCPLTDGYPFLPRKSYPDDYIRQYLHLRPRTNKFSSLLRVRDAASLAIHEHLHSEGYVNIHTPILTSNDCEGAGEVFVVQPENKSLLKSMKKSGVSQEETYFDTKAFLTVSGQLHLEAAVHGLSKVYTFGPTFRAENSRSRLHLSEFYMLEVETAFSDSIEDLTNLIEKLLKGVTSRTLDKCNEDILKVHNKSLEDFAWVQKNFPIVTYEEAVGIVKRNEAALGKLNNEGFTKEQEIFLAKHFGDVPTFVINWPKKMKPFYMSGCPTDDTKVSLTRASLHYGFNLLFVQHFGELVILYKMFSYSEVSALDLLAPSVGEIAGGSLRESDYNKLKEKLSESNPKLDWYLELRKYGNVPTSGFGLGFERYLQFLLGIGNIKDCIPFPRWPHNCAL